MPENSIVVFSRSYSGIVGGVEKLSLRITELLVSRGFKVHLISFDESDATTYFPLPEGVIWHKISTSNVDIKSSWQERFRRIRAIRIILKRVRPSVFIGFQVGSFLVVRIASLGLSIASVAAERNAPTLFKFIKYGKFKFLFYQLSLLSADIIAVQFDEYRNLYILPKRSRIRITPNSVLMPEVSESSRINRDRRRILYAGRLTFQKNVEVLLKALTLTEKGCFSLTIVGDGPSRAFLENYAQTHDLDIDFKPFQKDLSEHFESHDLLCLPSRWEGFPNVLAEAMSYGLPAIGFKEAAGVSALILPGINGELATGNSDSQSLANVLMKFDPNSYSYEDVRKTVGKYDVELFENSWISIVNELS